MGVLMSRELFHRAGIRWAFAVLFEPRDVWIGIYWDRHWEMGRRVLVLYFCLIPLFPVRLALVTG